MYPINYDILLNMFVGKYAYLNQLGKSPNASQIEYWLSMRLVKGTPRQNSHCFLDIHHGKLPGLLAISKVRAPILEIVTDKMDTGDG